MNDRMLSGWKFELVGHYADGRYGIDSHCEGGTTPAANRRRSVAMADEVPRDIDAHDARIGTRKQVARDATADRNGWNRWLFELIDDEGGNPKCDKRRRSFGGWRRRFPS